MKCNNHKCNLNQDCGIYVDREEQKDTEEYTKYYPDEDGECEYFVEKIDSLDDYIEYYENC